MCEINVTIIKGDITSLLTDAIVNPANTALKLGGGVAGTILRKGGSIIQGECDKIGYCNVGEAVITSAGDLKAKFVIHAVGPRYGIDKPEDKLLYNAVKNSLKLAEKYKLKSIALPAISTGIFGYPKNEAAEIIMKAVYDFVDSKPQHIEDIVICLFEEEDYKLFLKFSRHSHDD
ncbi:MAG: macro domain-containing protein [Deferribacterales bacterium]